jgi:DDE superfamily endonuclease
MKPTNDSRRVDETYIKVKGTRMYLYKAADSDSNTVDFILSPTRDAAAAKRKRTAADREAFLSSLGGWKDPYLTLVTRNAQHFQLVPGLSLY